MNSAVGRYSVAVVAALTLLVFAPSPTLAQGVGGAQGGTDERHEGIGIGVKGGFLFSSLSSDELEDFESRTGYQFGVFFGGNRPGLIGVMAEVNYGKKGAKLADEDATVDITYVGVPVMMRVNAGAKSLNGVSGYFVVGPEFQWLLDRKITQVGFEDDDLEDETAGFEVGLVLGGGVEITRFIIELRYIQGLKSISNDFSDVESVKSKAFAILFGIRFN